MKFIRRGILVLFLAIAGWYVWQHWYINKTHGFEFNILELQFASSTELKEMLAVWDSQSICKQTLIDHAKTNTRVDCVYILCYVCLLFMYSYRQMQRETNNVFNEMLRLALLCAILAGVLDYVENFFLFQNFRNFSCGECLMSVKYIAIPKFVLAGYVVLVLAGSKVKGWMS